MKRWFKGFLIWICLWIGSIAVGFPPQAALGLGTLAAAAYIWHSWLIDRKDKKELAKGKR